ncbi:TetR/AcrR family transcriptional regulator [Pendulispora albinea]|uniref:TetR/AcrR family transcriptional regulator n=1 Tax=Pendulispora albinea TaxID=2741071 RepID=A0ABZ2LWR0_9BACT
MSQMKSERRPYHQTARAESADDTRERIVRVGVEQFLSRPYEEVTLQTLAEAARVSRQTLLNHFGSKEGLLEIVARRVTSGRDGVEPGDIDGGIEVLIDNYERTGDGNIRLLALESSLPVARSLLEEGRAGHRQWLDRLCAPHLPRGDGERAKTLAALHAATDVYAWKLLRRDLGVSRDETARIFGTFVRASLFGVNDIKDTKRAKRTKDDKRKKRTKPHRDD